MRVRGMIAGAVLVLNGCSSETPAAATADTGTKDASADSGDAKAECAQIGGTTRSADGAPLPGVSVCAYQKATKLGCVVTKDDDAGIARATFTFDCVPPGENLHVTFEKDGYVKLVTPVAPTAAGASTPMLTNMVTTERATAVAGLVGAMYPAPSGKAFVFAFLVAPDNASNVGGGKVSIAPTAKGPYYAEESGLYGTTATATATVNGAALFTEVTVGEAEVTVANKTCTPRFAWPSPTPNAAKVPVLDGFVTFASLSCAP